MESPVRIIVTGAAGRMGQRLIHLAHESAHLQIVGATETSGHPRLGVDVGLIAGCGPFGVSLTDDLPSILPLADVVIDFTSPSATLEHVRHIADQNKAIVVGTTGFTEDELHDFQTKASTIRTVMAPNMSVGINVLLKVLGTITQALGDDYDIEIIEAHHNKKKDAPSGTALKLAEALAAAKQWDLQETGRYARHGLIGERPQKEIGMQTIRAGDIAGDHTILFGGMGERIEVTHRAHNRDPFARGALRAAEWVIRQKPGLYSMADVLGL